MTNIFRHSATGLMTVAGLIAASSAQAASEGRLHLPVAAHLGTASLAAGDYKISIQDSTSVFKHVILEGQGNTMSVLPMATTAGMRIGQGSLRLVEVDGTYFVKEYRSDVSGKTYSFSVPKEIGLRQASAGHSSSVAGGSE